MNRSAIFALLLLLSGCQSLATRDEDSPFYKVPAGSTLTLNQTITIPAGEVKVYFQDGRLSSAVNQLDPFCEFEVYDLKDIPQVVAPDTFQIYQTSWERGYAAVAGQPRLLASLGFTIALGGDFSGDKPSPSLHNVRMDLRSTRQPNVLLLSCGHLQDPGILARYLSVNQIRQALGEWFSLRLPAG